MNFGEGIEGAPYFTNIFESAQTLRGDTQIYADFAGALRIYIPIKKDKIDNHQQNLHTSPFRRSRFSLFQMLFNRLQPPQHFIAVVIGGGVGFFGMGVVHGIYD